MGRAGEGDRTMAKAMVTIERQIVDDQNPDASFLEQEGMGFEDRLAAYRNGDFSFVGVRAVATIKTPYGHDFIESKLTSPGLWGIESDSGETYFNEVFAEERAVLIGMLDAIDGYEIAA